MPLSEVETLQTQIDFLRRDAGGSPRLEILSRTFDGKFSQGQLDGTLTLKVRSHVESREPIVMTNRLVAIQSATVDGKAAMPFPTPNGEIGLLAPQVGEHTLQLAFSTGTKEERYVREVVFPFPAMAQTLVTLDVDEADLEVDLAGVLLAQTKTAEGNGTQVRAALRAVTNPQMRWRRQLTHEAREAPELEAMVHTLMTPGTDLVRTSTEIRYRVLRGEADRVRIDVPAGVEITHVQGPAVLQWLTERGAGGGRALVILFKHLVDDATSVRIETQSPVTNADAVVVRPLVPQSTQLRGGIIAIAGQAGFELDTTAKGATEISPSELPSSVIEMTQDPLLAAFTYDKGAPELALAMRQNETLTLTQALVDDLEAATVVTETGAVITKVRLTMRNTTRQHLRLIIPKDAEVTHALIDGVPFVPGADAGAGGTTELLIPLRQSEKVAQRRHFVEEGETLGSISLRYFNQTGNWRDILNANGLAHPSDVRTGQVLNIPTNFDGKAYVETAFTLEVAYRTGSEALGLVGHKALALPKLDLPVMRVAWHLYLPTDVEPLRFESNLEQLDGVRYDPLRRIRHFVSSALSIRGAWAGGYENILKARKRIYENESHHQAQEALSDFPLSGERTRFRRVLLRDDVARIDVTYTQKSLIPLFHALSFLVMAFAVAVFARRLRRTSLRRMVATPEALLLVLVTATLLVLATMVLGTHRAMLLGADAALLVTLAPELSRWARRRLETLDQLAVDVMRALRGATVVKLVAFCVAAGLILSFPLLLSSFVLVVLLTMTARRDREVSHASR